MKKNIFKLILAIIFFGLFWYYRSFIGTIVADLDELRETVNDHGFIGPLLYILLYIVSSFFFLPGSVITLTGAALFGFWGGTVYSVIGATSGAALAFFWSRFLLQSALGNFIRRRLPRISGYDAKLRQHGFSTVLILRLIPFAPFNGLNFAIGLTQVKFKDYIAATFLGIIPGTVAYVYFGDSLLMNRWKGVLISFLFIAVLIFAGSIYKRRENKN